MPRVASLRLTQRMLLLHVFFPFSLARTRNILRWKMHFGWLFFGVPVKKNIENTCLIKKFRNFASKEHIKYCLQPVEIPIATDTQKHINEKE